MNKLVKVLCLFVALFATSIITEAQVKIAHVNTAAIVEVMPERTKIEKDLEKYYKDLEQQLQTMGQEYQKKVQDYQANEATMSNLVRQSKEKEILDLQTRIQQFQANAEDDYAKKREQLLTPLLEKIQNAINAVGKEKGYTYILDLATGTTVYTGADAIDATPAVKAKLGIK